MLAILSIEKTVDWENPIVFGINKEPAHCTLIPYLDHKQTIRDDADRSPYYRTLNGNWKFNWVRKPADRPKDFYKPGRHFMLYSKKIGGEEPIQ